MPLPLPVAPSLPSLPPAAVSKPAAQPAAAADAWKTVPPGAPHTKPHDGLPAREFVARHGGAVTSGRVSKDAVRRILADLPADAGGSVDVGQLVARIREAGADGE